MKQLIWILSFATVALLGAGCVSAPEHISAVPASIDRSTASLPDAQAMTEASIANGETFALDASFVKKQVDGHSVRLFAYNGQVPGPLLRVHQGDEAAIAFTNRLDVPTTIHWHGIRVDNAHDGVAGVTQDAVRSGQTFVYRLKFPDPGLYWYHPHTREDQQQELGLYGLIWVEPRDTSLFAPVNQTAFVALDDILLSGTDVASFARDRVDHVLMGRFGNTPFINGESQVQLTANAGEVVRFAMVNTANTRVFKLQIPNVKMKLVGGDSGGYAHDEFVESITLAPSERAIVDVLFPKSGEYELNHVGPIVYRLGTISITSQQTTQNHSAAFNTLQDRSSDFADSLRSTDTSVDKTVDLTLQMPGMGSMGGMMMHHGTSDGGIEWEDTMGLMNAQSTDESVTWIMRDRGTGTENEQIDYVFKKDDKVKIRIFNDGHSMHAMQHPIHFHGNRFIVRAINGVKNTNPVWKDTVLVPSGATVDILLDASNVGTWMAHCHIAEHLGDGMMFTYQVH